MFPNPLTEYFMKRKLVPLCLCVMAFNSQSGFAQDEVSLGEQNVVTFQEFANEVQLRNPELRLYEKEIDAAKGGRRQAGIYENPQMSSQFGGSRVSGGGLSEEGTAWSVSVLQTFEYPGRMELRKAIANQDVRLAELGLQQFRVALKAQAIVVGFRLLSAQRKAEAGQDVAERLQELSEVMVRRDPAGVAPLIELQIVKSAVVVFRKKSIEASEELQSAHFEANLLRGKPLATPLKITSESIALPRPPSIPVLLEAAQKNSFGIQMRQVELKQQDLSVKLRRNERWPEISVGPFVSQQDDAGSETIAGIGLSLPLPFWNRNAGNIEMAQSRAVQAETSLKLVQLRVEQSVMEHALAYQLRLQELSKWGNDALDSFREAAELGDRHYRLGSLPIGTYMELQREYLDAVESIVDLQSEAVEAREQLQVMTGLSHESWILEKMLQ